MLLATLYRINDHCVRDKLSWCRFLCISPR